MGWRMVDDTLQNRAEGRFQIESVAKIVTSSDSEAIYCTLHNVSVAGACLEVDSFAVVPETFDLVPDDGQILGYPCRVIWRKGNRVGVKFEQLDSFIDSETGRDDPA